MAASGLVRRHRPEADRDLRSASPSRRSAAPCRSARGGVHPPRPAGVQLVQPLEELGAAAGRGPTWAPATRPPRGRARPDSRAAAPGSAPCGPRPCPRGRRADRARCSRSSIAARTAGENGRPADDLAQHVAERAREQPSIRSTRSPDLDQLVVGVDDRQPGADGGLVQHPAAPRAGGLPERLADARAGRRAAACWRARGPCRA